MISFITVLTSTPETSKTILKILMHCFSNFKTSDEQKLEWIIIDDGRESMKDAIPNDDRIKYYHFDEETIKKLYSSLCDSIKEKRKVNKAIKLQIRKPFINIPVGMKRNLACSYATGNIIANFEPGCYYFPDYPEFIAAKFADNSNGCITTDGMGHFNIEKYISIMSKQPDRGGKLPRYCIPLIAMTKGYWEEKRFDNQSTENEYDYFFNRRKISYYEYDRNVVRLHRESPMFNGTEPNGWHFKELSEQEYLVVVNH